MQKTKDHESIACVASGSPNLEGLAVCGVRNKRYYSVIRTMQGPTISVGPFACLEVCMNPIPIAAGILVKVLLEWLLDKE